VLLSQNRLPDGSQDVIIVVMPHIERKIAIGALQQAVAIQAARAARPNAMAQRIFG
jgi:hypothetical protein